MVENLIPSEEKRSKPCVSIGLIAAHMTYNRCQILKISNLKIFYENLPDDLSHLHKFVKVNRKN